ncbi:hypothetical protein [Actinoplanes sp. HUAS TT8]|uniref:hypothetical protein n=1 Tax=Actinoplanes sp. HUAS TT8 TaxID=3447453 RepID=UPI003F5262CB
MNERSRTSPLTVLTAVLIGLVLAAVGLVVLFVVSPASGISLLPDALTGGGRSTTVLAGGLVVVVLLVLAVISRRQGRGRASGVLISLTVAAGLLTAVSLAGRFQHDSTKPDRGCVVFVGGSEGCDADHTPPAPRPGG